jgi:hypothetical protein
MAPYSWEKKAGLSERVIPPLLNAATNFRNALSIINSVANPWPDQSNFCLANIHSDVEILFGLRLRSY